MVQTNAKGGGRDVEEALLYCSEKRLNFERPVQLNVRDIALKAAQTLLCRHLICPNVRLPTLNIYVVHAFDPSYRSSIVVHALLILTLQRLIFCMMITHC